MMAGVVRRDGLRGAVTALRDKWVADEGRTWVSNCGDELSAVLDAVPDVPPDPPATDDGWARLRKRIEQAVEHGYTEGDVNHNTQPIVGHLRLMLRDGKTPTPADMQHWVEKLTAACDAEYAWLNTPSDAADVRARAQEAAWDEGWSAARQVVREQKPGDNPYRSDRAASEREGAS